MRKSESGWPLRSWPRKSTRPAPADRHRYKFTSLVRVPAQVGELSGDVDLLERAALIYGHERKRPAAFALPHRLLCRRGGGSSHAYAGFAHGADGLFADVREASETAVFDHFNQFARPRGHSVGVIRLSQRAGGWIHAAALRAVGAYIDLNAVPGRGREGSEGLPLERATVRPVGSKGGPKGYRLFAHLAEQTRRDR